MIRVCLVDDQTLVRQGIRSLLELSEDIEVVSEAADGEEATAVIRNSKPDVVLLDVRMPRRNGLEVLNELKDSVELPPTIILTTFDDDAIVLDGIRAGAKGYLLKDVSLEQLVGRSELFSAAEPSCGRQSLSVLLSGLKMLRAIFPASRMPMH